VGYWCSIANSIICTRLFRGKTHSDWFNGIEILQGRWQHGEKVGYCYPSGLEKTLCKWDIYVPLVTKGWSTKTQHFGSCRVKDWRTLSKSLNGLLPELFTFVFIFGWGLWKLPKGGGAHFSYRRLLINFHACTVGRWDFPKAENNHWGRHCSLVDLDPVHAMTAYGWKEVQLHTFVTFALQGGDELHTSGALPLVLANPIPTE